MFSHDKYPYPFEPSLLENPDVLLAREKSRETKRWIYIPIVFLPDYFVFVDANNGIIKFSFLTDENGDLIAGGGIYNPKKGEETLLALIDILRYISKITNKNIIYKTLRINRTQGLVELLLQTGFVWGDYDYELTIKPNDKSKHTYPEVNEEINKLMIQWYGKQLATT